MKFGLTRGPVPEGIHAFEITEAYDRDGKEYPMVEMKLRCLTIGISHLGLTTRLSTSPKARWVVESFLDAIAADRPEPGTSAEIDSDDFIGQHVLAEVEHREFNGRLQADVKSWITDPDWAGWDSIDTTQPLAVAAGAKVQGRDLSEEFGDDNVPF